MAKSVKKPPTVKRTLPEVVINIKKAAPKPAKLDSMVVGGTMRSVKDISKAVNILNKSNTAKGYVKGINASSPYGSTRTLASKGTASDLVNKVIDNKKGSPRLMARKSK